MGDRPRHLLDGYKVLDFTHFVAGPTTTRLMAGMGRKSSKSRSRREATMHASSTISIIIAVPFLFNTNICPRLVTAARTAMRSLLRWSNMVELRDGCIGWGNVATV